MIHTHRRLDTLSPSFVSCSKGRRNWRDEKSAVRKKGRKVFVRLDVRRKRKLVRKRTREGKQANRLVGRMASFQNGTIGW